MEKLEKQKQLASIIKGIHQELRNESITLGANEAWNNHLQDKHRLNLYAETMKELSEEHWNQRNETKEDRIDWVINFSEYYFHQEEMERFRSHDFEIIEKLKIEGKTNVTIDCYDEKVKEKLYVLDVGSCGNFFKKFEKFDILPIDISPASSEVFYCDFLTVPLTRNDNKVEEHERKINNLVPNTFDIIIFCLLLEYLPASEMRILCCEKAHKLLKTEGILFIITPDSNNQNKNVHQIKTWKYVLAKIGFRRIKVEKLKNLTCMAFRKSLSVDISRRWAEKYKEHFTNFKLEIPQDKKKITSNNMTEEVNEVDRCIFDLDLMNEMPIEY